MSLIAVNARRRARAATSSPMPVPAIRRVLPAVCAAVLAAAPAAAQEPPRFRPGHTIDDVVAEVLDAQRVPGAVIVVVQGDSVVFMQAFGRTGPDPAAPRLDATATFRAAPLTELVNALAAVSLAESGGLRLDEPLGTRVADVPPELRPVTLDQLLTHTAGMSRQLAVPGRDRGDDMGAAARRLTRFDRVTDPGVIYSRSPIGTALAALAIEVAAGTPYAELVRQTVFRPLGMHGSGMAADMTAVDLAPGWSRNMDPDAPVVAVAQAADSAVQVPVRGLYSTASDLAALAAVLLSDGSLRGERVLPAGAAAELWRPRAAVPASSAQTAPGMRIDDWEGRRSAQISGGFGGHHVHMQLLRDDGIGVVILANSQTASTGAIAEFVFRRMLGLPAPDRTARSGSPTDAAVLAELAAHAGSYENGSELIEIVVVDGAPKLKSEDLVLSLRPLRDGAVGVLLDSTRVGLVFRLVRDERGRNYLWIGDRALSPESVRGRAH